MDQLMWQHSWDRHIADVPFAVTLNKNVTCGEMHRPHDTLNGLFQIFLPHVNADQAT